jgi:hypothetical protein
VANPSGTAIAFTGPIVKAQLAWSALRGHELDAVLLNQNTGTMYRPDNVQVVVPSDQLQRALEVLVELGLASLPEQSTRDED